MTNKDYAQNLSPELVEKINYHRSLGHKIPPLRLIKTPKQIEKIKESAKINTALLDYISENIKEGLSTQDIDEMVYEFTISHGAIPAPLHYEGFPKSCCISRNQVVCHGIPRKSEIIKDGDIVNVDVSTIYNKYFSDASRMFLIGNVKEENQRLVKVTKECLEIGIETAKPWTHLGDLGAAIQEHAESNGYSVVRELCGHGIGLEFHEDPNICHYGKKGTGMLIIPGMIFTIEPMINMGKRQIYIEDNDWTVVTQDGKPSAQWEHQILITETGNEIISH